MTRHIDLLITSENAINEMDIIQSFQYLNKCSIREIIISEGNTDNYAIILVDQWHAGTKSIRQTLIDGKEAMAIRNLDTNIIWMLFEYKGQKDADLLNLDVLPSNVTDNREDRLSRSNGMNAAQEEDEEDEMLHPNITDNRAERLRRRNEDETKYQTPVRPTATHPVAPNAPRKENIAHYTMPNIESISRNLNALFV